MSTPKTDAREKDYWDTPTSHVDDVWEFARELERENAALKQALDAQMQYQRELRADRDRLDWLGSNQGVIEHWEGEWYCEGQTFATFRAAIDAAMREGKL